MGGLTVAENVRPGRSVRFARLRHARPDQALEVLVLRHDAIPSPLVAERPSPAEAPRDEASWMHRKRPRVFLPLPPRRFRPGLEPRRFGVERRRMA